LEIIFVIPTIKKSFVFFYLLLSGIFLSQAQVNLDSLENSLKKSQPDSVRLLTLLEISKDTNIKISQKQKLFLRKRLVWQKKENGYPENRKLFHKQRFWQLLVEITIRQPSTITKI